MRTNEIHELKKVVENILSDNKALEITSINLKAGVGKKPGEKLTPLPGMSPVAWQKYMDASWQGIKQNAAAGDPDAKGEGEEAADKDGSAKLRMETDTPACRVQPDQDRGGEPQEHTRRDSFPWKAEHPGAERCEKRSAAEKGDRMVLCGA